MKLFGHEIPVRTLSCSTDGCPPDKLGPYVNLFIRVTDQCNMDCPFCVYHSSSANTFSTSNFDGVLNELARTKLRVKKISFTGGEPTIFGDILDWASSKSRFLIPKAFQVLNTNGYLGGARSARLNSVPRYLDMVDNIALSCHHWGFSKSRVLFGAPPAMMSIHGSVPEMLQKRRDKLHMRCNLVKGFVDSAETIYEYLCHFSEHCDDFGFVSLRRANDYCRNNFVDTAGIDFSGIPQVFRTRVTTRGKCCCRNYMAYNRKGQLVHFYVRTDDDLSDSCESILVYDIDHLKIGFSGETIYP